jgi:hypothetical protein
VIKGRWGFSKADFESNDPSKVSPFELRYLGSTQEALSSSSSSSSGGGGSETGGGGAPDFVGQQQLAVPPSGPYKGNISVKQEGRGNLRVAESDVSLTYTATGKKTQQQCCVDRAYTRSW